MAADSSLVNASFNLGKARAGANTPNMAPLIKANVSTGASFLKIAQGAMGGYKKKQEIKRVGKEKQLKGFEKIFNNTLESLYEQEEPLPQPFIDMLTERVEGLQAEFETYNTYGKGDTAENNRQRARMTGELKRITNEIQNYRGGLMQFAIDRKQGLLNDGLIKQGNIAPAQQVLDLANFNKNVAAGLLVPSYGEDGKIQVLSIGEWGEVIVTMESLNKAFPPINTVQDTNILEKLTESGETGRLDGLKQNPTSNYDYDQRYSEYLDDLDTDGAVSNIVARKIKGVGGNNPSFKDALLSDITIPVEILNNMFVDENNDQINDLNELFKLLDINPDGVLDEKDLAAGDEIPGFEKNLDAMIDAITNEENPAYSRSSTAKMLATYLTKMDEEKYKNNYNTSVKSKQKNTDEPTKSIVLEVYRSFESQDNILDLALDGGIINSWNGYEWIPDPDKPGNYKNIGLDETYPLGNLLRGRYFGLGDRITKRNLPFTSGFPEDLNPPNNEEEVTPNAETFRWNLNRAGRIEAVDNWTVEYPNFKFEFDKETLSSKMNVTITAPNEKKLKIKLGSGNLKGRSKIEEAKVFNEFIKNNKI